MGLPTTRSTHTRSSASFAPQVRFRPTFRSRSPCRGLERRAAHGLTSTSGISPWFAAGDARNYRPGAGVAPRGSDPELMARSARADGQAKGIQSVEIGTRVLEAVAAHGGAISLSAIAAAVHTQSSHVYRYVVSLVRGGLLAQAATPGHYDLGAACVPPGPRGQALGDGGGGAHSG